jgi:hypothetical protein
LKYEQELTFGIVTSCNNVQVSPSRACFIQPHSNNTSVYLSANSNAFSAVARSAAGRSNGSWRATDCVEREGAVAVIRSGADRDRRYCLHRHALTAPRGCRPQ